MQLPLWPLHLACLLVSALLPTVDAVYADEAYQVDFHYALLGRPQANSTFFHQPYAGSKASLLYTLSHRNIVGAVNPKDGAIVWRQQLPEGDSSSVLRSGAGLDVVLSASGSRLIAWSAADGRLAWEHSDKLGSIRDICVLQGQESQSISNAAFVSFNGKSTFVKKLSTGTGDVKWTFVDTSGDDPYRIAATNNKIYVVSLHKAMLKGLKIKVTSLDVESGEKIEEHLLSSDSDVSSTDQIIDVSSDTQHPLLAWTDKRHSLIKVNVLGSKAVHTLDTPALSGQSSVNNIELHHARSGSDILVNFRSQDTNWAETFRIDNAASTPKKLWDIRAYDGTGVFSTHTVDGKDFFVRITEQDVVLDSSTERLAAWPITSWGVPGLTEKLVPIHVTSEVVVRPGPSYAVRSAVLMSSGDWIMIRNGETSWTRPEALAGAVKAVWAEVHQTLPAQDQVAYEETLSSVGAFVHRVRRHASLLQSFSGLEYIQSVLSRALASSSYAGFGFSKVVVLATDDGRLIGLDTGERGRVLFNVDGTSTDAKSERSVPELPWTSVDVGDIGGLLHSNKALRLAGSGATDPRQNSSSSTGSPVVVTEAATRGALSSLSSGLLIEYYMDDQGLHGQKPIASADVWHYSPYPGFRIHSVNSRILEDEPVSSIGKVMGDRSVLYKYLNPNTVAIVTVNDERKMAVISLLDGVSGTVLWNSHLANVDTARPISSALSEHWLAFSYTMDSVEDESVAKGFQIVMNEFYESDLPNDRGRYGHLQNYSTTDAASPAGKPYAFTQSHHIPEEISQLAVTQTGQGITTRMLLAALPRTNSIVSIPPQLLDPRRVLGKDPTMEQMMEGLSRYTAMIDFDPQWYLNHRQEILGLKEIKTTPALLESTSLVFAYGLDVFGTRITPSYAFDILAKSFNKLQLSLTVAGLFLGVIVVAPFIQRKQTNMLWQAT